MPGLSRLLLLTFIESFATICVERGIYFFTDHRLGFAVWQNLLLGLGFGLVYAAGAAVSHPLTARLGERRLMLAVIAAQLLTHVALAVGAAMPAVVVASTILLGLLNGAKWPIIESYVGAGKGPLQQARAIGRFNIAWSIAVPPSLVVVGPLIDHAPAWLFLLPALLNAGSLLLCLPLSRRPVHLDLAHPERPSQRQLDRTRSLLSASRLLMFASYVALFVLAPLMPEIFKQLGVAVAVATSLSAVMDLFRLAAFVLMERWSAWHGRRAVLTFGMAGMLVGVFMVLLVANTAVVLAGEVLFGLSAGMIYYCALYYAMLVKNASVDAGGAHETLIGLGFAIGPAAGLAAVWLGPVLGSTTLGTLAGVAPPLVICSLIAAWPLARAGPWARSN